VIGEIFDRVYLEGSLTSPAHENVQTIKVAPGGSGIVEFRCEEPGRYVLVDHALSRAEKGLAGYLIVEGPEQPEIFASLDDA
jgi:nitrite reductase (NO-forming)